MRFSGYSTDFYIPFILGTQGIILNLPLVGLGEIDPLLKKPLRIQFMRVFPEQGYVAWHCTVFQIA